MTKVGWREQWAEVRTLREELESHEVDVPVVVERTERREGAVKELKAALISFRKATHGKVRTNNMLKADGAKARAQERKLRAATKREINAVMERPARGTIEAVSIGRGDDMEVVTDPVAVAEECCEFGKRRMGSMQPKWFRQYDVAAEHEVWFRDGVTARAGRVTAIGDDGRCTVADAAGGQYDQLKREQVCHEWQLEEAGSVDGPDAAGAATCRDGRRMAKTIERMAATKPQPEDTAIFFWRNEEGREFRRRAAAGELASHDISRVPECFHGLLEHLPAPVSKATGLSVHPSDYETMVDDVGTPRQFYFATIRRKLGSIAKHKAPGLSCNGPDLYACLPTAGSSGR